MAKKKLKQLARGVRGGSAAYAGKGAARRIAAKGENKQVGAMNRQLSALSGVKMTARAKQGRSSQG